MTKQKEIREGMEGVIKEWIISNYPIGRETFFDLVKRIQEFEDSQGVVVKVDRELPENKWPLGYYHTFAHLELAHDAVLEAQQDMLKAGYVAVEPLVKEE